MSGEKIILYGIQHSPPVRAVLLTLHALELPFEFKEINVAAGEHLQEEYLKKNPQHSIPLIKDGNNYIWDSHAICAFLVRKYGGNNKSLYPEDFYKRAVVDQRLHYENGVLFTTCLGQIVRPIWLENAKEIPEEKIAQIHEAYTMLEKFLDNYEYMAGDDLTIADFSIVSTVSSFTACFASIECEQYPKLYRWLNKMTDLSYYNEANGKGMIEFSEVLKNKLPKQFNKLWKKAMADIKNVKLDNQE